jgi:hypothetical protein
MKKIFLLLSGGIMVMTLLINNCFAQTSARNAGVGNSKTLKQAFRNILEPESPGSGGIAAPVKVRINPKAMDDFQTRYKEASKVLWIANTEGFVSYFNKDGLMNRVYYDKKGHWIFSVLMYNEDKLPRNIRSNVKSQYFDMAITLVEELQYQDSKAYVVYLEDHSNIKILKVNEEGECEVQQDLIK